MLKIASALLAKVPWYWIVMVVCMVALYFAIIGLIDFTRKVDEFKRTLDAVSAVQTQAQTSTTITDQSLTRTIQINTQIALEQKAIDDEVERRVREIRTSNPAGSQTDAAVTRVQFDSLWDTYCAGNPSATGCPK